MASPKYVLLRRRPIIEEVVIYMGFLNIILCVFRCELWPNANPVCGSRSIILELAIQVVILIVLHLVNIIIHIIQKVDDYASS